MINILELPDIYFTKDYAELYKNDNSEPVIYELNSKYGKVRHVFLKRKIPILLDNITYYDLITPYGYGGPIIIEEINKEKLVEEFHKKFKEYCNENNIVSEFVRFHPLLENRSDFEKIYNPIYLRKTVGTNLEFGEEVFINEFSKSCRRDIKQTLKKGITYNVQENVTKAIMQNFIKIYYETMKRLKADSFYFFDESYFENILYNFPDNIIIVEAVFNDRVIASDLYLNYNGYLHLHLSGTLDDYLYLAPSYVLRYAIVKWGIANNYRVVHYGGGTTNEINDGLYKFKKRFGKKTDYNYYIGKKIWNIEIYHKLVNKNNTENDESFERNNEFPAYRY